MIGHGISKTQGHAVYNLENIINAIEYTSGSLTITTPLQTEQAWQRDTNVLSLSGTYSVLPDIAPKSIEWRVGNGDWVSLISVNSNNNNWTGILDIPANYIAQGTLEVRIKNAPATTSATHDRVTISDIYLVNGQSNSDGYATDLQSYTGTFDWLVASNGNNFAVKTSDPTWNSNGSIWPAFAEILDANSIPPVFVNGATIDGTGYISDDWNPGDLIYSQAVTRINNALLSTGGCVGEFFWQGEKDSRDVNTEQGYFDASVARRNGFDTEITNFDSNNPTYIFQLGEHSGLGINNIRKALKRLRNSEDARFVAGPNLLMENWGDGTHAGTVLGDITTILAEQQLDRIAQQAYRAVTTNAICPTITSITTIAGQFDKLLVIFDKSMENHTSIFGWSVYDTGGEVTVVSSTQGANTSQVILTMVRDLYGPITVDFGEGSEEQASITEINNVLREAVEINGIKLPPEVHYAIDAGVGLGEEPSGILLNGSFDTNLAEWTQSGAIYAQTPANGGSLQIDASQGAGGDLFLRQDVTGKLVGGQTYNFSYDIVSRVAGAFRIRILGSTTVNTDNENTVGTFSGTFVAPANATQVILLGNSAANMVVDNVEISEV